MLYEQFAARGEGCGRVRVIGDVGGGGNSSSLEGLLQILLSLLTLFFPSVRLHSYRRVVINRQ